MPPTASRHPNDRQLRKILLQACDPLRNASAITVLVNDPQRATASRNVLEALAATASHATVRVLVATGTHQFSPAAQAQFSTALTGGLPVDTVAWHDARCPNLVSVANRWRGHPWLLEPPELLAVGSVEPHYFAGFTGAHKTCTIGLAAFDDITANHALAMDHRCGPCLREGNPVFDAVSEMVDALTHLRPVHAVNFVQNAETITAVTLGSPVEALDAAADIAVEELAYRLDAPAPAVVAEVSGPLAVSFYQADKGIKNNESAVADGGAMVLVAPCPQGLGPSHFTDLLAAAPDYTTAVDVVRRDGYRLGDHKAVRLRHLTDPATRNVKLFLVSEHLTDTDAALLGMTRCPTVDEALHRAGLDPADPTILHLSDAANRCPRPGD